MARISISTGRCAEMAKFNTAMTRFVLLLILIGLAVVTGQAYAAPTDSTIKSRDAAIRFDVPGDMPIDTKLAQTPQPQPTREKKPFMMSTLELPPRPHPFPPLPLESAPLPNASDGIRAGHIEQDFDHFTRGGPNEGREWLQRFYYTTDAAGRPTGAASEINFLMLGGEAEIHLGWLYGGAFTDWAREWGAPLATAHILEHRFYGQSELSTGAESTSTERLQLLTAEQSLADAAVYISQTNKSLGFKTPRWVVFGGSYAGNLAAWMRVKYPDLVIGAVASSAPVEAKLDFHEYLQTVDRSFKLYGRAGCANTIRKYFSLAQKLIHSASGRRDLGICKPWKPFSIRDIQLFMTSQLWYLARAVQNDDLSHARLSAACEVFQERVAWLERSMRFPLGMRGVAPCSHFNFDAYIQSFRSWKFVYYWFWQTCSEFGYAQTSARHTTPSFSPYEDSNPVDFHLEMCKRLFGADYNAEKVRAAVKRSNDHFGGAEKFKATNVVFINGSEDPWHPLSVLKDKRAPGDGRLPSVRSILVPGTSHCYDMYSLARWNTPPQLAHAHSVVKEELKRWLGK